MTKALKNEYFALGLMSGTSMDGLDIAYCRFKNYDSKWSFEIIATQTISYPSYILSNLNKAVEFRSDQLLSFEVEYSNYLASAIQSFIKSNSIAVVDLISSHGHTIFHQPHKGFTLQIGRGDIINRETKIVTISDFRTQDVLMGGQGAPLVPIGDKLLFSDYCCRVNLGGFANISFDEDVTTFAYDICPLNTLLNRYSQRLGHDFDRGGQLASKGNINNDLLAELNNLEFYKQKYPKSLGVEWNDKFVTPLLNKYTFVSDLDMLRTLCEHMATQIALNLKPSPKKHLFTGGGSYNTFLMQRIQDISKMTISIAPASIIEFKEAMIFAFLGVLKLRGEVNCLSTVTGAFADHSSGKIFDYFS